MIHTTFQEKQLSLLGFGTMRLPVKEDKSIDEAQVKEMVAYAMAHGVNYFDTAWPYHSGESERIIGKVLGEYDRGSYYLATKYPGHQITSTYDPAAIFEKQLEKCGVEYFDFYLLHNVYEKSMATYLDPRWGILEYFKEQKRLGRIKHLGFSTHGSAEMIRSFLDVCGEDMEFCQIQLNYLDWTLQEAKAKYELLKERGIPVWVMEPVRGGRLAALREEERTKLKAGRGDESVAAWAFRFLQELDGVQMILSGMSNMEQMVDNVKNFAERKPLSVEEMKLLLDLAEGMKQSLPCTACRYCVDGCPAGLNIPALLACYNELRFQPSSSIRMRVEGYGEAQYPSNCVACGKCAQICPQNIDIPEAMKKLEEGLNKLPSWEAICRQREAAQKT